MAFEFATEEERKKFNQGTQDALGILFDGDDAIKRAVSYSDENGIVMPPINPDEYVNLGITDDQGNVTEKGLLIYNLKEAGIFDDDLKLTTKGRAYTIPQEELLQDKRLLEEFEIARQDGLYGMRQSFSFEDAGEAVAGMVSDAAKGIGKGLKRDSAVLFDWLTNGAILSPKYREELASEGAVFEIALREGFRENTQLLAQMGKIGIVKAESAFAPAQNEQHDQQERMALASARQDLEYTKYVQQNQKLGELADQLELTIGPDFINSLYGYETPSAVQQVEIARETLGESEVEQIAKEGQAVAEFAGPENLASVGVGAVVGAGRSVTTRLALSSQRLMSEYTTLTAGIAKTQAQIVDVTNKAAKAQRFSGMASQAAKGLRNQFDEVGDQLLLKRAREADELATRQGSLAAKLGDDITPLLDELAALTAQAKKMSNVPTSIAKSYAATQELGARIFKEGPFRFAGATMEVIGKSLTAVDDTFSTMAQRSGIGAVYNTLNSGIGIAGIAGTSAVLGPIPAYVAGVKTVLNSGKIIERLGNTFRILGKEMVRARGQVPFWRRVANVPNISSAHRALAHGLDHLKVASLYGGTKTFAKGTIASFPIDLGFEYLAAGAEFNQSVVNQALAESSVLGGSSAALGGLFKGSNKRFRELSAGDELNFIRDLTPEQKSVFFSASPTMRRAISTFSAVFPNSDVRVVRSGGDGGYHDQGKIVIDLDSKNPLKELLGHEVAHHISYVNQMDQGIAALLIGDGEFGGILRSPDGTLDEGFRKFSDEYKRRMAVQYERNGQQAPSLSLDYLANEYFADVVGRRLFESAVSGELGKAAARTTIERKIAGFIDGILPKAPIVKNFHARIGGQFDASGNMVMGSGLLSEGLKDLPEIRNMMKNMVTTAAGYSMGQFKPIGITDKSSRVSVPINKNDKPMINLVGPVLFKGEYVNGVWQNDLDKNGDPIPISSKFDSERASSGFVVADAVAKNSDGTEANGQMRLKDGEVSDGWMPQYAIKALKDAGILNPVQIRIIQNINNAIKNFDGKRFSIIYHAALGKSKKGKIRYESLEATIRDVVPMGFKISKKGNILVSLMDVRRLNANVDRLIDSKRGLSLYGRNRNAFMQDLGAVMDIWNGSGSTDSYFQSKYPSDWQRRKNFVNLAFGLSSRAQTMIDPNTGRIPNPLFLEDNIKGNSVFATYRADRMSRATNMSGEKPNMPVQYASVVGNLMPNGLPTLDENGNPVAQKFYDKSIQQDSGQRLMPEGVDEDKFYSQLDRVITEKVPTRATAAQIMATIDPTRGSGVKADEIKWSGIEQALASLEKDGKVSKEDLLNYLRNEGRVRFEEVTISEGRKAYEAERARLGEQMARGEITSKEFGRLVNELDSKESQKPEPKYAQYQLPGGENYREVVLAMQSKGHQIIDSRTGKVVWQSKDADLTTGIPEEAKRFAESYFKPEEREFAVFKRATGSEYTSSHFPDIPNYVAHMRTNERVDADGRPGLFVEEFQSDRHQEGRKKGYRGDSQLKKFLEDQWESNKDLQIVPKEEYVQKSLEMQGESMRVADAPFRTTWPLQLFKRALRDAVDSKKDWIGWTVGKTQNDRFDLSKQVGEIRHWKSDEEGYYGVQVIEPNGQTIMHEDEMISTDKLADLVGKDVAQRIVDREGEDIGNNARSLSGDNLKMGGSGMKGFYDTMLPKEIGKYVKPFGGKVEKSEVATPSPTKRTDDLTDAELLQELNRKGDTVPIWKVSITPEMRKLAQGQMRFMPEAYRGEHTAPTTESAPASDLTSNGVYPADVYTRPDWYEQDDGLEEMRKIQRLKGKPDSPVWIHRAVPLDVAEEAMKLDSPLSYVFRGGDWVTTSKQYAKDHGESALNGKYRVFSKRVKAKDIYTNGDSIFEWGYNPEETEKTTKKSTAKGNSSAIANAAKLK
jgi:hypothetical protein